jgi:hypothetical protein
MDVPDMIGQTFGRLRVVSRAPNIGAFAAWACECECGNPSVVTGSRLRRGITRSCGCLAAELSAQRGAIRLRKHGHVGSAEYNIWQGIVQRCTNPKNPDYPKYGGAGIGLHGAWRDSFEVFLGCVGPRPSTRHSIDRFPNKHGGYEPGNVRWATPQQQSNNRTDNASLTLGDETHTIAEWSRLRRIPASTIRKRLACGRSIAESLTPLEQRVLEGRL